ncbi:major capsid protein [Oceanobacter kriegii]|uniref:major capsid protein n=1 Tax=Oceanobacter kriegii TaxID=64972 RepID=UPI0003F7F4E0|nr:major capsid protein [Oceanobacter kriegii]
MKKLIRNGQAMAKSTALKASGIAAGALATSSAFAIDSTAVSTALSDGNSTVTTVVTGLVGIVAIMVGFGYIVSLLRKS